MRQVRQRQGEKITYNTDTSTPTVTGRPTGHALPAASFNFVSSNSLFIGVFTSVLNRFFISSKPLCKPMIDFNVYKFCRFRVGFSSYHKSLDLIHCRNQKQHTLKHAYYRMITPAADADSTVQVDVQLMLTPQCSVDVQFMLDSTVFS